MSRSLESLYQKIEVYKNKYYKNLLLKGALVCVALLLSLFLFLNFIEYLGWFGNFFRGLLLFFFVGVALYTIVFFILDPVLHFFNLRKRVSNADAAEEIGKYFPEIGDKLLNTIQLSDTSDLENDLILASIEQKSKALKVFSFSEAIHFRENKKYLKYSIPPLLLFLFISAISPSFFSGSQRIIHFRQDFEKEAPFQFTVLNQRLSAYRNEDYELRLSLSGNTLPEEIYLSYNSRRFRMNPVGAGDGRTYSYTFNKLQQAVLFNFEAAGFLSNEYTLSLINRPELLSFDIEAKYPAYLKKTVDNLENVGNLIVPEGTNIRWLFNTLYTDSLSVLFSENDLRLLPKISAENEFIFNKKLSQSSDYKVIMRNWLINESEEIDYYIHVIPDEYPVIQLEQLRDTTLYNFIALGGNISDDYGLSKLQLHFKTSNEAFNERVLIDIPLASNQVSQTFFYSFDISSLNLEQGESVEYYLEVWDNDGVNGEKSSKSSVMTFGMPSTQKHEEEIEKQVKDTENSIEDILQKSKDLKKMLADLDKDLKSKKELNYQDKKRLEDLLRKRDEMLEDLKRLQKQFDQMKEKQNRFQEYSPESQKKMDQLQQLLNQLMEDKESDLFDQLEEMLKKNEDDKLQNQIEKLNEQERNLDRDVDRTLKLFKNLQLNQKVERVVKELEALAEKQKDLAAKTLEKDNPKESENKEEENSDSKDNEEPADLKPEEKLAKDQEKLNEEFQDKKEKLAEIEKLSKELRKDLDTQKNEQKEISQEQEKAEEQLKNNQMKGAAKSQKKAAQKMKSLAEKMKSQAQSIEMQQMQIDIDALRAILENLLSLSFDQESIMRELKGLSPADPRYKDLSQKQLKIVDDAQVIEDSLYSLAQRVMQLESFVTKEVTLMKNSMDQSIELLRDRSLAKAAAKQQFSMTSMNNLALLLSDTFEQMQNMMSMAGGGKGEEDPGPPSPTPGEQQQGLNKRLEGLGKSEMGGAELSKELGKIANEQAKIRKQIKEMQDQLNGTEEGGRLGGQLQELEKEMDKSEEEIVNKRVNSELIRRQKSIETRLLEVEKSIKEQGLDPKRKAKSGLQKERESPPSLQLFMKEKEKQLELIRTTPPSFTPFYKKETDNYFRRIK